MCISLIVIVSCVVPVLLFVQSELYQKGKLSTILMSNVLIVAHAQLFAQLEPLALESERSPEHSGLFKRSWFCYMAGILKA
jgi:hypothetical protein